MALRLHRQHSRVYVNASWNGVKSYGDVDVTAPFSGFSLQVDVCFLMMLLLQGNIFTCHFTVESQPHQPSLLYHTTRYRKEFPYYANIPDTHSNTIGAIHSVDGYTVKILCRSRRQVLEFPMSSLTYSPHFIVTKAFMLALILKEEMVWTEYAFLLFETQSHKPCYQEHFLGLSQSLLFLH